MFVLVTCDPCLGWSVCLWAGQGAGCAVPQDSAISTQQLQETGGRLCLALHLVSVPGDLAALEAARAAYWSVARHPQV